jgi:hypothetical protein
VEAGFYTSVHYLYEWLNPKTGQLENTVPGYAFRDLEAALTKALTLAQYRNVWQAMGGQAKPGQTHGEQIRAIRKGYNIEACNCLYMDIDVDLDQKKDAYRTRDELTAEFQQFIAVSGMPYPSLVVNSGRGGIHAYWILDRLLTPADWKPYAKALENAASSADLKFDSGVTTDSCRLLRIPGTLNYKTDPPSPVTFLYHDGPVYLFETIQDKLMPFVTQLREYSKQAEEKRLQQSKLLADEDYDDLGGGIGGGAQPRNIDQVAKVCPFIRHTLANGGAGYGGAAMEANHQHCVVLQRPGANGPQAIKQV